MRTRKTISILMIVFFPLVSILAQSKDLSSSKMPMGSMSNIQKAVCLLQPTAGNNVTGVITFTITDKGIKVVADLHGLIKGKHGLHIHECGDCTSSDGLSAGGHFNPDNKSHGSPTDMMRHNGDLGNIEADDSGNAHLVYIDDMITFDGEHSIIGRSVIIHKGEDDLKTQPTGNSGARVSCGVIGIAK